MVLNFESLHPPMNLPFTVTLHPLLPPHLHSFPSIPTPSIPHPPLPDKTPPTSCTSEYKLTHPYHQLPEVEAATAAGLHARIVSRPGNAPVSDEDVQKFGSLVTDFVEDEGLKGVLGF
ncbi:hypothetical protein TWF718_002930 [Orbilia javanica]|uniref:Uncharacterized protein n=1 Tax=Orbilia javanica TaxID=47235 RepID=A0AAN8MMD4_9PEZI